MDEKQIEAQQFIDAKQQYNYNCQRMAQYYSDNKYNKNESKKHFQILDSLFEKLGNRGLNLKSKDRCPIIIKCSDILSVSIFCKSVCQFQIVEKHTIDGSLYEIKHFKICQCEDDIMKEINRFAIIS
jgi:hypothetical protein